MRYIIGVDEAGYGPNLGPLVIGATVWEVDDAVAASDEFDLDAFDLYAALEGCVRSSTGKKSDDRLHIADSKQVYKAGKGFDQLERGVLCGLKTLGHDCEIWQDFCQTLAPDALGNADLPEWYADYERAFPSEIDAEDLARSAEFFSNGCDAAGVRLRHMSCRVMFADEFNTLVDQCGSKGVVLSEASVQLVAEAVAKVCPDLDYDEDDPSTDVEPAPFQLMVESAGRSTAIAESRTETAATQHQPHVAVFCDKHGGRNKYAGLLQHVFPDSMPRIKMEGPERSAYECQAGRNRISFRFEVGGERHLPVALASMTAKYLRETVMQAFNAFWQKHLPDLRTTAGYPVDAKRFLADIEGTMLSLDIPPAQIWRIR